MLRALVLTFVVGLFLFGCGENNAASGGMGGAGSTGANGGTGGVGGTAGTGGVGGIGTDAMVPVDASMDAAMHDAAFDAATSDATLDGGADARAADATAPDATLVDATVVDADPNAIDASDDAMVSDAGDAAVVHDAGGDAMVSDAGDAAVVHDAGGDAMVSDAGDAAVVSDAGGDPIENDAGAEPPDATVPPGECGGNELCTFIPIVSSNLCTAGGNQFAPPACSNPGGPCGPSGGTCVVVGSLGSYCIKVCTP